MAAANTKSQVITAGEAVPQTFSPSWLNGAAMKSSVGTVEVAAADDDGSVYRLVQVPSSALILGLEVMNDAITAGTDYDLGVYKAAFYGGAVVSQALFAQTIDMSAARTLPFDAMFETLDISNVEKRLWEMLGLSSDPQVIYEICFTANTVGSAAGTLVVRARWAL